jgi:hypothetical protein
VTVNSVASITGLSEINDIGGPETTSTCMPTETVTIDGAAVAAPFSYSAGTLTVSPTLAA